MSSGFIDNASAQLLQSKLDSLNIENTDRNDQNLNLNNCTKSSRNTSNDFENFTCHYKSNDDSAALDTVDSNSFINACDGVVYRKTVMKKGKLKRFSWWTEFYMYLEIETGNVFLYEKTKNNDKRVSSSGQLQNMNYYNSNQNISSSQNSRHLYAKIPAKQINLRNFNTNNANYQNPIIYKTLPTPTIKNKSQTIGLLENSNNNSHLTAKNHNTSNSILEPNNNKYRSLSMNKSMSVDFKNNLRTKSSLSSSTASNVNANLTNVGNIQNQNVFEENANNNNTNEMVNTAEDLRFYSKQHKIVNNANSESSGKDFFSSIDESNEENKTKSSPLWYVVDLETDSTFDICHKKNGTMYRFRVDNPNHVKKWVEAFTLATS